MLKFSSYVYANNFHRIGSSGATRFKRYGVALKFPAKWDTCRSQVQCKLVIVPQIKPHNDHEVGEVQSGIIEN